MVERNRNIKVLVVDDSIVFREILSRGISSEPGIEVIATAEDPYDARDKILQYKPDVMTCDIEMPKMSGIEFIHQLLPQYPLPIIVVSSLSGKVFDAIHAGAVDFVAKPDAGSVQGVERFIYEMIDKIKIASRAQVLQGQGENLTVLSRLKNNGARTFSSKIRPGIDGGRRSFGSTLIAIGASTGGTEAIYHILRKLPPDMPGIVIVQHIPPKFSRMFADRMNSSTNLEVKEAGTGDYIEPGKVFIAPGDQHMKIRRIGNRYKVECFEGDRVNGHCPSVDVLFDSVAKEAGKDAIGVILTGMGYDGARGLLAMKRKGARTIGQDEKTSVVYGMPKAAYDLGAVDQQATLEKIGPMLIHMLK